MRPQSGTLGSASYIYICHACLQGLIKRFEPKANSLFGGFGGFFGGR